jgi:hypothetical protein
MFELHVADQARVLDIFTPEVFRNVDNFLARGCWVLTCKFLRRWSLDADGNQIALRGKKLQAAARCPQIMELVSVTAWTD